MKTVKLLLSIFIRPLFRYLFKLYDKLSLYLKKEIIWLSKQDNFWTFHLLTSSDNKGFAVYISPNSNSNCLFNLKDLLEKLQKIYSYLPNLYSVTIY